jgi:hypothetical protein
MPKLFPKVAVPGFGLPAENVKIPDLTGRGGGI